MRPYEMNLSLSQERLPGTILLGTHADQPNIQRALHTALCVAQQNGFVWMASRVTSWPPMLLPPLSTHDLDSFKFSLTPKWSSLAGHWLRSMGTSTWLIGVSLTYEDL